MDEHVPSWIAFFILTAVINAIKAVSCFRLASSNNGRWEVVDPGERR